MPDDLGGKVAVVTGASTGIGRSVAQELVRRGARVVIAARSRERVEEAAAALGCTSVVADVTRAEDVARLVDGTIASHGGIDILVANAGVYVGGDLWDSDPEALDRLLTTNVNGVVRTVRAVLPHLLERGEGDILVTSSVSGHQAIHWEPVYSASKHALQAFVHGMRRQLIGTGVRIGAIAPGIVLNDLWGVVGSRRDRGEGRTRRGDPVRGRRRCRGLHAHPSTARDDPGSRDPAARTADLSDTPAGRRSVAWVGQAGPPCGQANTGVPSSSVRVRNVPSIAAVALLVMCANDAAAQTPQVRLAAAGDCPRNVNCIPGLKRVYGMDPTPLFISLEGRRRRHRGARRRGRGGRASRSRRTRSSPGPTSSRCATTSAWSPAITSSPSSARRCSIGTGRRCAAG